jgi:LPS sulfotransferase NodH
MGSNSASNMSTVHIIWTSIATKQPLRSRWDSLSHELGSNPQRDRRRDKWLAAHGIQTVRIRATEVRDNLDGVVASIVEACRQRSAG